VAGLNQTLPYYKLDFQQQYIYFIISEWGFFVMGICSREGILCPKDSVSFATNRQYEEFQTQIFSTYDQLLCHFVLFWICIYAGITGVFI